MSSFGIGQMYLLAKKFEKMGWGPERITKFAQSPEATFRDFAAIMDGRATVVTTNRRLPKPMTFTIAANKNPKRLKDCKGVWLSEKATRLFATAIRKLPAQKRRAISFCDLPKNFTYFEIMTAFGGEEAAVFASVRELEATISQLITKKADKSGLLNDGKNLFHVRGGLESFWYVMCVIVEWEELTSEWSIHPYDVDTWNWSSSLRVFAPTAE